MIQDVFMQKAEIEQVDTGVKYMSVLCVREEREVDGGSLNGYSLQGWCEYSRPIKGITI